MYSSMSALEAIPKLESVSLLLADDLCDLWETTPLVEHLAPG